LRWHFSGLHMTAFGDSESTSHHEQYFILNIDVPALPRSTNVYPERVRRGEDVCTCELGRQDGRVEFKSDEGDPMPFATNLSFPSIIN
jgi:hypothetical protein